ncbi:MAG: hypothetical protein ABIW79_00150, partial [Gemmatimonas sp.]
RRERSHWETVRDLGPALPDLVASTIGTDPFESAEILERLRFRRLLMRRDDGYTVPGMVRRAL